MNEEHYWIERLNFDANYAQQIHQSQISKAVEAEEMNLFSMLKPKVSIDGNQYCVLYGENLMEGVAGFGDTLMDAIWDFNKSFRTPIELQQPAKEQAS
jgi:hypothetical protein